MHAKSQLTKLEPQTANARVPRQAPLPFSLLANVSDESCQQPKHDGMSRPLFNADAALARVDGDPELLWNAVGLFAIQWRKLWDEIAKACKHRDAAVLELTAHRLKESVDSFGADEASRLTQEMETRGREGNFHDVDQSCARLKAEFERLVKGLKAFAKELNPRAS
jgi:HPt (histidine-containing phosphotransfer) domain-containing protein